MTTTKIGIDSKLFRPDFKKLDFKRSATGSSARPPLTGGHDNLKWLPWLSKFLDSGITIPGTSFKIGLDGILGLIPGVGDALTTSMSVGMVFFAAKHGVSKLTLVKMLANVLLDSTVGMVPVLGDIFDFFWKSNNKNLELLKREINLKDRKHHTRDAKDMMVLAGLLLAFLLVVVGLLMYGALSAINQLFDFITWIAR